MLFNDLFCLPYKCIDELNRHYVKKSSAGARLKGKIYIFRQGKASLNYIVPEIQTLAYLLSSIISNSVHFLMTLQEI